MIRRAHNVLRRFRGAPAVLGLMGFLAVGVSSPAESALPFVLDAALQARPGSPHPALEEAVVLAVNQGVDEELLRSLLEKGDPEVLSEETLISWIRHAGDLSREDLPVTPVVSRYLQGLAKGVPVPRIESAVRELEGRLRQAAVLVDTHQGEASTDPSERLAVIDHAAYDLGLGIPAEVVGQSLSLAEKESTPEQAAQAPVLTLGILVASGLSESVSYQVVETAWQNGYRGENLERLGVVLVEANPAGGAPPQELVDEVLALLGSGESQDRFFEGLDELMGRQGYRVPSMGIDNDALGRVGTRRRGDPIIETPKDPDNQGPKIDN